MTSRCKLHIDFNSDYDTFWGYSIYLRGCVRDFQADFTIGVKHYVAFLMKRVNYHISWKFGKNENPCFHSLPGNPVHSLLIYLRAIVKSHQKSMESLNFLKFLKVVAYHPHSLNCDSHQFSDSRRDVMVWHHGATWRQIMTSVGRKDYEIHDVGGAWILGCFHFHMSLHACVGSQQEMFFIFQNTGPSMPSVGKHFYCSKEFSFMWGST